MAQKNKNLHKDNFVFVLISIYTFGGLGLEFLRRYDDRFESAFFSERLNVGFDAIIFLIIQTASLWFFFLAARELFRIPKIKKSENFIEISQYILYFGVICLFGLFGVYHLEYLWNPYPERFEGAFYVNAIITLGSSVLIFAYNISKFRPLSVISFMLFTFAITYAASTGSRSAALPFLAFAGCALANRHSTAAAAFALLSLKALLAALTTRSDPSFSNFVANFFAFDMSEIVTDLASVISLSFPAGYTVQAALNAQVAPDGFWTNILYLSPIPSSFLPEAIFEKSTLSDFFGFSSSVLGINTDIYSDPVYRGGIIGAVTYPIFLCGLYIASIFLAFSMPSRWQYSMVMLSRTLAVYSFVGGMVFSYRAATRWQLVFILILAVYVKVNGKKRIKL